MRRSVVALAIMAVLMAGAVAGASPAPTPGRWVGANPYGFYVGDSIAQQCGEFWGMGWRSLGFIGWPGANTDDMRARLDGTGSGWPAWTVTESSVQEERQWFRDAGWLVVGLGANDVRTITVEQFTANVDWFMAQSRGRPVLWFTIHTNLYPREAQTFNAALKAAAQRWPNLRLLPWYEWAEQNPQELLQPSGVHVAYSTGCDNGRNALIRAAAPAVDSAHALPVGYWYPDGSRTGTVRINGWGAALLPTSGSPVWVNVRSDFKHVGRWQVTAPTGDIWAQAAGGHAFGVLLGPEYRGHLICLDLLDASGQWTSLGCRTV